MALGFLKGRKGDNVPQDIGAIDATQGNTTLPPSTEKDGGLYDPEANDEKGGRKMSRVTGMGASDTDSTLSVGQQLELEATNSIKYRTCSWQKVIPGFP